MLIPVISSRNSRTWPRNHSEKSAYLNYVCLWFSLLLFTLDYSVICHALPSNSYYHDFTVYVIMPILKTIQVISKAERPGAGKEHNCISSPILQGCNHATLHPKSSLSFPF